MLRDCVTFRSNMRYDCDWRRWATFIRKCLRTAAMDDLFMMTLTTRQQVEMLVAYGHYCLTEHKPRPIAAGTISGSLSGIRHYFRANFLDTTSFDHRSLRAFKTSAMLTERKKAKYNQGEPGGQKAPMTLGMVQNIVEAAKAAPSNTAQAMCAVGI